MINLGNVAGVVKGSTPPMEADGVTEKRYVLWAKISAQSPELYELHYFDESKGDNGAWVSFKQNQTENLQAINTRFNTLIGDGNDPDTVINTLTEVFNFVKALPEGDRKLLELLNAKVNTSDIVNNLASTDTTKPLSANKGRDLKRKIDTKVNTSDIVNNLASTDTTKPLSANMGRDLKGKIDTKVNTSDIVHNLDSVGETLKPLSAGMGQHLYYLISERVEISDIVNDLVSNDTTKPLSANMGRDLQNAKVNISDIVNNFDSLDSTKPLSALMGGNLYNLISLKVNTSDIVDNLRSTDSTKPLSANMGRDLQNKIGAKLDRPRSDQYSGLTSMVYKVIGRGTILGTTARGTTADYYYQNRVCCYVRTEDTNAEIGALRLGFAKIRHYDA